MNVGGELARHVVVDDGLDSLNIQTTRGEIGSEEVLDLSVLEVLESLQTLEEGDERREKGGQFSRVASLLSIEAPVVFRDGGNSNSPAPESSYHATLQPSTRTTRT